MYSRLVFACSAFCLLSACTLSPRGMLVPSDLASAPAWEVEGWHELRLEPRIRFGDYEVHAIEWTGHRPRGVLVGTIGESETLYGYSFRLRSRTGAGADLWRVECENTDARRSRPLPNQRGITTEESRTLFCTHTIVEQIHPAWSLHVGAVVPALPHGFLARDETQYSVVPERRTASGSTTRSVAGFVLTRDGTPLAAVQTLRPGAVRFEPGVPPEERDLLASVAAALILQSRLLDDPM